jgi:hypothetical protein
MKECKNLTTFLTKPNICALSTVWEGVCPRIDLKSRSECIFYREFKQDEKNEMDKRTR